MNKKNSGFESSLGLKIAAIYLVVTGFMGITWVLFDLGSVAWRLFDLPINPYEVEFNARNLDFRTTVYIKAVIIDILYIISGVGVFLKKSWARNIGLVVIVIASLYSIVPSARGLTGKGHPEPMALIISAGISFIWHGIFFYLLLDRRKKES